MKLVFMGSDTIALPLLNWLKSQRSLPVEFAAIYTQPDRPVGRGQKVVANGIKQWAIQHGIPVRQPERLTKEERELLANDAPDLALVMAYGHILRDAFIDTPKFGTLNLHTSILPELRGASPIQSAVANGNRETGVTLMRIVRELDAGPVTDVERVPIAELDTALEVEAKLAAACVPLITRNLEAMARGELVFRDQDAARATFCRRLIKSDGGLDFAQPATKITARINGLFPWPSCRIELAGQIVKLGLAKAVEGDGAPGAVLLTESGELEVGTPQGRVRLLKLQRPGGKMLPAADFLRGFPIPDGAVIPSTAMPKLISK